MARGWGWCGSWRNALKGVRTFLEQKRPSKALVVLIPQIQRGDASVIVPARCSGRVCVARPVSARGSFRERLASDRGAGEEESHKRTAAA